MASVTAPIDGRPQYSFTTLAIANASLGRPLLAGAEQVGPDRFVLANSWPKPRPTPISQITGETAAGFSGLTSALWPNLR